MKTNSYFEDVSSLKTTLLFLGLAIAFFGIFIWRVSVVGFSTFPILCLFFFQLLWFIFFELPNTENKDHG